MTKEETLRRANYWLVIIAILIEEGFPDVAEYVEGKLINEMNGVTDQNHGFFSLAEGCSWDLNRGFFWDMTNDTQRFSDAHHYLENTGVYATLRSL